MNLFNLLTLGATRYPKYGAVFHGSAQFCDWETLRERSLRISAAVRKDLPKGARIAIAAKNCPQYIELLFAAWAAGMVVVPLNAKLHPREMAEIIEDSGAELVFASSDLASSLASCGRVITIGGPDYISLLAAEAVSVVETNADAFAWLFFTSGTTGRSKGALLSHRNLMAMTMAHLADFENIEPSHGIIHAAPMSHGSGLYVLPYIARAARQIIPESSGFEPAEILDLCAHHRGIGMFMAPTMVQRLRLEVERRGEPPAGLRTIIYGGGPMYLEEIRKALVTMGPIFCQLYGQGEAPMTITGLRPADFNGEDEDILASVGWPRTGVEVAIFDEKDRPMPPGQIGEVVCRGDVVMSGYWNNAAATSETLRGGWLHTGDMGLIDETGKLTLRDRSKDVIISGGTNIYPREVEEALLTCPGVEEVSVVGEKDDEWGETVVAFVVAKAGLDSRLLDSHCLSRIARFKRPKRYIFINALPKSSYGKVLKRELLDQLGKH